MTRNTAQNRKAQTEARSPDLIAWYVDERGEKAFWTRIGAAWDHKDGEGLTLQLDLIPTNGGRIVLRTPAEEKAEQPEGVGA